MQTVIQQQQLHLYYMQSAMQGEEEMRQEVCCRLQKKTAGKAAADKEGSQAYTFSSLSVDNQTLELSAQQSIKWRGMSKMALF